ncbi:MAG: SRPBCC family protein [Candidatus Obscuribacterales bacterium]|nr:SRPBCC family protein [Candidatus Obscuribacterales bacterium]
MSDMGKILNSHTVQFHRVFPGPIERVFDYLTKPELLATWLMEGSVEPAVGGRIEYNSGEIPESIDIPQSKESCCIRGLVKEYEPPLLIAYSWNELNCSMTSEVRFELEAKGDEVHLILTHSRLTAEMMPGVGAGWHTHLESMLQIIKGETPGEFFARFEPRLEYYKAAAIAAGIVIVASAGSASAQGDPAYESIKVARDKLISKYDQVWKDADNLKYKIDQISKAPSADSSRTLSDLDKDLRAAHDELHKIEFELRDLDMAIRH